MLIVLQRFIKFKCLNSRRAAASSKALLIAAWNDFQTYYFIKMNNLHCTLFESSGSITHIQDSPDVSMSVQFLFVTTLDNKYTYMNSQYSNYYNYYKTIGCCGIHSANISLCCPIR